MATQQCPLCSYHGRSDHLRRHLKKHARTIAIDCPNDWNQLSGTNLYVKSVQRILPTGEPFGATKYPEGVCFDCCKYLPLNTHDLTKYSSHVCAEKEERPHRKGVAPTNKKSDAEATLDDIQTVTSESSNSALQDLASQCRTSITAMRKPDDVDPTTWLAFKSHVASAFNIASEATGGDLVTALPDAVKSLAMMNWQLQKSRPTIESTIKETIIVDGSLEKLLREHPQVKSLFEQDEDDDDHEPFCDVLVDHLKSIQKYQTTLAKYAKQVDESKAMLSKYEDDRDRFDLERKAHTIEVEALRAQVAHLSAEVNRQCEAAPAIAPPPAAPPAPVVTQSKPYHARQSLAAPAGGRELR